MTFCCSAKITEASINKMIDSTPSGTLQEEKTSTMVSSTIADDEKKETSAEETMAKKDGAKKMSTIAAYFASLSMKEDAIRSGKLIIPSTTVVIKRGGNGRSYPTIKLGQCFHGWLSEPDLDILHIERITRMPGLHGFVLALHLAFAQDNEFTLRPDDIWLVISQGFSHHINMFAEKYRKQFVHFDGKKTITIRRDNYGPWVKENPWSNCFPEFTEKITKIIGAQNAELVLEDFSTTTAVARMATQVVLMDLVKQYLDYKVRTKCGIPKFHIQGSPDDWAKMLKKIQAFRKFDLDWWVDGLEEILGKFLNIVSGKCAEKSFLNSFYKFHSGSGGDDINGEMVKLFPYLKNYQGKFQKNEVNTKSSWGGVGTDSFPSGKSDVPFVWDYFGQKKAMHFRTFSVPVHENGGIAVKPVVQVCASDLKRTNKMVLM